MAGPEEKLDAYYRVIANTFPSKVQQTLKMIGEPSLELLALRRYIQKEKDLDVQWVWSERQIKDFEKSPEYGRTKIEIDKVKQTFTRLNGEEYTLGSSPIRNLDKQVRLWKGNKKVRTGAKDVRRKCLRELANYPDLPDLQATGNFRTFLKKCSVHPEPTSAAPGLSDHGQMHAVDFVILKKGETIAGTDTQTIESKWDAAGWTDKLKAAVTQSASLFDGPLRSPREPWHYSLPGAAQKKRSA
jgi:hypothetical protein